MAFEPHQALTGVLPLPDPSLRVYPLPYPQPGPPMHARPWPASFPPAPVPVAAPIPPGHAGSLLPKPIRSTGATAVISKSSTDDSRAVESPFQLSYFARSIFSRVSRANLFAAFRASTTSPRPIWTAAISKISSFQSTAIVEHTSGPMDYRVSQGSADTANDTPARQVQMLRSVVSDKKAVSKVALRLLQSVKIEDLPEKERTCVICYNDYGVETPEGINEVPLRLPKCRHVFGDHCIKRWFEESDSCPYCRDKLHSEPKLHFEGSASQAFMAMMRVRTQLPPGTTEEMYLRLMSNLVHEDFVEPREHHVSERRSYRANGDSDSSAPDGENTATSSTPASPIRIPPRDTSRHTQWPPRVAQQRSAHSPLGQERDVARYRRQRYPRNNLSSGTTGSTNADGDLPTSSLPPLQTVRPDGPTQSSTDTGDVERISSLINAESQAADSLAAAPAPQNRNRPW
ncbi:ring-finger domain containing [Trichoderma arundinaceum]|uniref:Ring-finger domain containing n=1 Tax=Trichoderma arundinaceum TaxID=490622 RepID=A0A395NJI8_TRIAR|nr:ring-finger domain containing [Trichoderma arundinaceum]